MNEDSARNALNDFPQLVFGHVDICLLGTACKQLLQK